MYNQNKNKNDHKSLCPPPIISPRISFSNEFLELTSNSHQINSRTYRDAPVSFDFEFSVSNQNMMSADELFYHGKLLPSKENGCSKKISTIRDELEVVEDDNDFCLRPPRFSTSWKGFLGLKKSHMGSKKIDKTEVSGHQRSASLPDQFVFTNKTSQEMINETGSGSRNVEYRQ